MGFVSVGLVWWSVVLAF